MWIILSILLSLQVPAQAQSEPDDENTRQALETAAEISKDIDQYLLVLERSRHGMVWGQGIANIIRTYPFVTFYFIEQRLRRMGSNTYLLAAPKDFRPENMCSKSLLGIPPGDLDFHLWVEVNGENAAAAKLREFGVESAEQNLRNLLQTGFLVLKPKLN